MAAANGPSTDIAVVGWAQTPMVRRTDLSETQLLLRVITDALEPLGLTRADIDFTCLGSCDYITGQAFSFVSNLDAIGAWPPKRDSHVEMDGAWALYEAWLRLQEGDIEIAVVTGSGRSSTGDPALIYPMEMDPFYLAPLGVDPLTFAALQARALDRRRHRRRAGDGRGRGPVPARRASTTPTRRSRATPTSTRCSPATTSASHCAATTSRRSPTAPRRWCSPPVTGPASCASGRRSSPASTTAPSATTRCTATSPTPRRPASRRRPPGSATGPVEVAELQAAFTHEEILLRRALGLGDDVAVNRSGGALASNPIMATGLARIGYAANHVFGGGKRALAHSTSGPCLQQNLVCILEGDA